MFYPVHLPLTIHYAQFVPTVKSLASDQQLKRWLPMIDRLEMMGAYAQTELGHGSDIQHLETTATYHHPTQQFILHSPTISSIKFWPGDMGVYGNYAIVFA